MVDTDGQEDGTRRASVQNSGYPDTASRKAKRTKPHEQIIEGGSVASGVTAQDVRKYRTTMVVLVLKADENAGKDGKCRCDAPDNQSGDFRQAQAAVLRAQLGIRTTTNNVDLFKCHFHLLMEGERSLNSFVETMFKSSEHGALFMRHFSGELNPEILKVEAMLMRSTTDPATSFSDDLRRTMDLYMVLHCPHRHNFDRSEAMGGTDPGPPKRQGTKNKAQKRVVAPAAKGSKQVTRRPKIRYSGHEVLIEHEEFVQDIETDSDNQFAYDVFSINPLDFYTFPWLSAFAVNFESFVFDELVFTYKTAASTSTAGKVIMATDFDAKDDTSFETKATLLQWEGSVDGPLWSDLEHRLSPANLKRIGPTRFVAGSALESQERLSSAGNFYIATTGVAPAVADPSAPGTFIIATLGELWVKYRIRLITPSLQPSTGMSAGVQVTNPQWTGVQEGNIYPSSTKEVFSGFPGETIDTARNKTFTNPDAAGVYKITVPAGFLMDSSGNLINEERHCLYFQKDWVGDFSYTCQNPSGYAIGSPMQFTSAQYVPATPLAAINTQSPYYSVFTSLFKDIPNLLLNTVTGIINNSTNNLATIIGRAAFQKGTFWAIRTIANYALANNANNRAVGRIEWRPTPKEDLFRAGWLDMSEVPKTGIDPTTRKLGSLKPRKRVNDYFAKRAIAAPTGAASTGL